MTRQDQNNIILAHIDADIKDKPDIQDRISSVYNQWFQALVQAGLPAPPMPEEQMEEAV